MKKIKFGLLTLLVWTFAVSYGAAAFGREKAKGTTGTAGDFNLSNKFTVEIDGVQVNGIQSVTDIKSEIEVVAYKDGEDGIIHTRPGNHKPGKMTITKDWSNNMDFYKWFQSTNSGSVQRKSISVIFHNDAGEEAGRMNFYNTWPTAWTLPDLNVRSSGHAGEKLEISWETMELKASYR